MQTQPHKSANTANGFTLIEVVIALTILAISIAGAVSLANQGFIHLEKTSQHQQASYFARNHLIQLEHKNELQVGSYSGRYAETYHWALTLSPVANQIDNPLEKENQGVSIRAFSADLNVNFQSGQRRFHSLIIVPAKSLNTQ